MVKQNVKNWKAGQKRTLKLRWEVVTSAVMFEDIGEDTVMAKVAAPKRLFTSHKDCSTQSSLWHHQIRGDLLITFSRLLYTKKNAALGIDVTLKKGKKAGAGYFNEHLHIAKDEIHTAGELPYLQQDFEEE